MLKSQDMLPDVDAGIFLDNDMLVLQDPALLWDEFKLFTPFTAMAVAPVEAHYSREMVSSEQNNRREVFSSNFINFSFCKKNCWRLCRFCTYCIVLRNNPFLILAFLDLASTLVLLSWTWQGPIYISTHHHENDHSVTAVETPRNCTILSMLKLLQDFLEFLAKVFNGSNIKYLLTVVSLD